MRYRFIEILSYWIILLLINVAIESAHHEYERNSCKDWFGQSCDQRQSVVSNNDAPKLCLRQRFKCPMPNFTL